MSDALRVLLVSGEYPPMEGGVADYTRILGQHLAAQGAVVHVLTSTDAHADPGTGDVARHAVVTKWTLPTLRRAIQDLCRRVRPHVVNVQYQTAAYGMRPAINFLPVLARDIPVVVTFHDLREPYLFPKAGPLRRWVNLFLARHARAVIVTNAQDRQTLERHTGLPPLHAIPIGSNVPCLLDSEFDRAGWRQRWGIPDGAVALSYFGFLNASKGGEDLIGALGRLVAQGCDAYLLMIGGAVGASDPTNRAYLARVREDIKASGLDGRVIWTGYLDPHGVSASFRCTNLTVLPYRDGVSIRRGSLMAALAHGMPIVSTVPQVPEEGLCHGENVWLVPPADPDALAGACYDLIRDPVLRERLSRGAWALHARFAWPDIAARTLEVFSGVATL